MEQLFKHLPADAKVWIYQSSRKFTEAESTQISALIEAFVNDWTSHSRKVIAGGALLHNRFIVLAADETAFTVSGCSIDSSVNFIRQLEQQFDTRLFDRLVVAYRDNGEIKTADRDAFQKMVDEGTVNAETIVFNNLVSCLKDFPGNWEVPLSRSWHAKFFRTGVKSV